MLAMIFAGPVVECYQWYFLSVGDNNAIISPTLLVKAQLSSSQAADLTLQN